LKENGGCSFIWIMSSLPASWEFISERKTLWGWGCEHSAQIQVPGREPASTKKQFYLEMSHCRLPIKNLYWDAVRHGRYHVLWDDLKTPVSSVDKCLPSTRVLRSRLSEKREAILTNNFGIQEVSWEWKIAVCNSSYYPSTD
jgi:hypothetical protein